MHFVQTRVDELGVDFLTIAGHKLYAPKGVGAVYIRSDTLQQRAITIPPLLHGASQENGLRGISLSLSLSLSPKQWSNSITYHPL